MGPKKLALWFLIVSVAVSAVFGIIAILTGSFGDLEIRIIFDHAHDFRVEYLRPRVRRGVGSGTAENPPGGGHDPGPAGGAAANHGHLA